MLVTFYNRLNISLCYCDVNEIRIVYIVLLSVIHLFYQSNNAKIKTNTMKQTKDYTIILIIIILLCSIVASSKPVSFKQCNQVTAPLRCKAIKTNGKQCLNASYKCDTLCKFHLNTKK